GRVSSFLRQAAHDRFARGSAIACPTNPQSAVTRAAKLVGLHGNDVNPIWVLGMYHHGETKIRRDAIGNVLPVFGIVIGAIQAPVILKEKTFGTGRVHRNLVYTLPELGVLVV